MKLLDTWAWIEYFKGTEKGAKVKQLLDEHYVATSAISLAELSKWFYQNKKSFPFKDILQQIKTHSLILPLDESLLIESGYTYLALREIKKDIGLIDSIIYTTAQLHQLVTVTNDPNFQGFPDVEMI